MPWDLALVEVALFERASEGRSAEPRDRLIVPTLVGRVQPEIRQVVRVSTDEDGGTRVKVEHVSPADGERAAAAGRKWDRVQFEAQLGRVSLRPEFKELVRSVLALVDRFPDELTASFGTGERGSVTLKRHDKGLLELHGDGRLWWRPRKFAGALGESAAREYGDALLRLFPGTKHMGYPHTTVEDTARQAGALLEAIKSALAASAADASSASSPH